MRLGITRLERRSVSSDTATRPPSNLSNRSEKERSRSSGAESEKKISSGSVEKEKKPQSPSELRAGEPDPADLPITSERYKDNPDAS